MTTLAKFVAFAAWLGTVSVGGLVLMRYEVTPGATGPAPDRWPADSRLPRAADRPTVLLFAHPRCPCTRASLGEFAAALADSTTPPAACVVFVRPPGCPDGWERGDLWDAAAALPGVTVR